MQRWAVSLELAAARAATTESTVKQRQEALEVQSAHLSAQEGTLEQHERQLEELSRELAVERQQLEKLAEQLEVCPCMSRRWPPACTLLLEVESLMSHEPGSSTCAAK